MTGDHQYTVTATWTGNRGTGTSGYRDYDRSVKVHVEGKPDILASADAIFRGDPSRWNPEDMLIAALAQCHMLSYLHACVERGVVVMSYVDDAVGHMEQQGKGGHFVEVVLHPRVHITDASKVEDAITAHDDAHDRCFIASSMNFPVRHEAIVRVAGVSATA
ncbi:OsmC family protein [Gordonia sp. NPDC003424]